MKLSFFKAITFGLLVVGCARVSQVNDANVSSEVLNRTGYTVHWNKTHHKPLTEEPLTVSTAVQVALVQNPTIQATFEELGISHADVLEANLYKNPLLEGFFRFPHNNYEFSLTQNIVDFFLMPLKKKVAEVEFEKIQLYVANAIIQVVYEVQEAFYRLAAAEEKIKLLHKIEEIQNGTFELANAQKKSGTISDLQFQMRAKAYAQAQTHLLQAKIQATILQERLYQLLGYRERSQQLVISCNLKKIQSIEDDEFGALAHRLDIQIMKKEIERIQRMIGMKKWWSYTDGSLGISTENDISSSQVTGPSFSLGLPLFNYGQADRARLLALLRQHQEKLKVLEIEVISQVKRFQMELKQYHKLVRLYQETLLPQYDKIVQESLNLYNVMGIGVFSLLEAKQDEVQTQIEYLDALEQFWLTKVSLERALGGKSA